MNQISQKPLLRWAGSKKKLIPILSAYWSDSFDRYVEPFMGSACLFFALQPKQALLGDLNSELVATYQTVCAHPKRLADLLAKMPIGATEYYALREKSPGRLGRIEAAARFIYLNRFCFNGLFRTNSAGKFNVPYGGGRTGQLPSTDELRNLSRALKKCTFIDGDFEKVLSETKEGDFVYLDPPFAVANRRVFHQYGPQNFGLTDLERLRDALIQLDKRGISFVLSYAYCSEAIKFFKPWPQRKVFVRRNISGFVSSRRRAAELIVSNINLNF